MLSKKDKEEVLRLRREEDLTYKAIHEKTNFSINKIMNVCKGKLEESQKEEVEENQKEEIEKSQKEEAKVHFDDPIEKVRAIPEAIDNLIETEQLKEGDRAEWEKRIEDIRKILRTEVDERIAGERKDATETRDEEWQDYIEKNYEEKEVAAGLRSILEGKNTTIKGLTETIDEKDTIIGNLTNAIKGRDTTIGSLKLENTNLNNKNIDLNEYIEKYLENAGRRERRRLEKERGDFIVEKTYVRDTKKIINDRKKELDIKISEEEKLKKENIERKKELDKTYEANKIQRDDLNKLSSTADITLREIKREQDWLDERQKQVERLESVQSREQNIKWQEQKIAKDKKQFEEEKKKQSEEEDNLRSEEQMNKMMDRITEPMEGIDFTRVKLKPA